MTEPPYTVLDLDADRRLRLRWWWNRRSGSLRWALRHPGNAIQRRTRLPWGRRAFPLAVRTHLGRVDVRAMREAMMLIEDDELIGFGTFGPNPRGLDEVLEPGRAFALCFDEYMLRRGQWGGPDDWALAHRWTMQGEPRIAAWVRARIDLAEDRPPHAITVVRAHDDKETV